MRPEIPFYPLMFKAVTLEMALIYILTPAQRDRAITQVNALAARGVLVPRIGPVFDLADCAAAHEAVERGARDGAVLVRPG
jgi:NADPH2:quinone reductase